jgi:hypothetical protein
MAAVGGRALGRLKVQERALCQPMIVRVGDRFDLVQDRRRPTEPIPHFHADNVASMLHSKNPSNPEASI